ncbi:MAG: hypothetical protein HOM16_09170 [Woeseia sp.]|nr:hypothetical protein [Woeseia sp.]
MKATRLAIISNAEAFSLQGPAGRAFIIRVSHPHADDPNLTLSIKSRKSVRIYVLDGGGTFGLFATITRYMQWGGELPP